MKAMSAAPFLFLVLAVAAIAAPGCAEPDPVLWNINLPLTRVRGEGTLSDVDCSDILQPPPQLTLTVYDPRNYPYIFADPTWRCQPVSDGVLCSKTDALMSIITTYVVYTYLFGEVGACSIGYGYDTGGV